MQPAGAAVVEIVPMNPPEPAGPAAIRGSRLFEEKTCSNCHGPNADGVSGYILPAGFPPFSLLMDKVKEYPDGYIYGMIRVGRTVMPAYGDRISHFDRWNVVNYVRVLQGVVTPPAMDEGGAEAPSN